jgi:alpha-tubulin suppressor-like RCC1 family protein
LWTWGGDGLGTLGLNGIASQSFPTQVGSLTDWAKVGHGGGDGNGNHNGAIKTDGTLWMWGANTFGAVGDGTTAHRSSPVQIGVDTDWTELTRTTFSTAAIKTDGTLWTWGRNDFGQLGDNTLVNKSSPVQTVAGGTNWKQVSAGDSHIAAVKTDGTLWAWGNNGTGRLGLDDLVSRSSPVQVGADTDWDEVHCGFNNTFALKTDGTLWAWGGNGGGALGLNDVANRSTPVQVAGGDWIHVRANLRTAAIKADGTLWTWGDNFNGALGHGISAPSRSTPTQVGVSTNWEFVDVGENNMQATFTGPSSRLYMWGYNAFGQLGLNDVTNRSSPIQVGADGDWSYMAADADHTLAIKMDGTLWSWGLNTSGQLGHNDVINRSSPVQVGALADWAKVVLGEHTAAIKTDSTLWTWGNGSFGRLGHGDATNRSLPTQVGGDMDWASAAASGNHTMAVKTDGTLWAVGGFNSEGTLGLGDTTTRFSPEQVGALTNWASVSLGGTHAAAIKTDGTLWTWGRGDEGQLGSNAVTDRSSPVQVGGETDWAIVSCGDAHTMAIKTDGSLWAWGGNSGQGGSFPNNGSLGLGDVANRSNPTQVGLLMDWARVSAGGYHTLALKTNGTLWTWGGNLFGAIGDGTTANRSSPLQIGTEVEWSDVDSGPISLTSAGLFGLAVVDGRIILVIMCGM